MRVNKKFLFIQFTYVSVLGRKPNPYSIALSILVLEATQYMMDMKQLVYNFLCLKQHSNISHTNNRLVQWLVLEDRQNQ